MSKINDKLYRIFTEAKNITWLKARADSYFDRCTFFEGQTLRQGILEDTLVIEIFSTSEKRLKTFAREICRYNEQTSVLIQESPCILELIYQTAL